MRGVLLLTLFGALACGRSTPVREQPGVVRSPDPNVIIDPTIQNGAPPGCVVTAVEQHTLPPMQRRPIDVLLVIDDSCSMEDDQSRLASNFSSFFSSFQNNQVDFHLGAITTDMRASDRSGRLVSPFLTNATPNLSGEFTSMVSQGSQGSSIEQGLGAASAALHDPLLSGANAGFVRPEADFGLVFIGDEDDQSNVDIRTFASDLRTLKGNGAIVVASIVGLDSSWTCFPGVVSGWRLAEFARQFGQNGLVAACRDDWAGLLRSVAGRIVSSRCIVGLRRPLDDRRRIHITVNGTPATWVVNLPEDAYPNGSIEVAPCPEGGGIVEIGYDDCQP